MSERSSSYLFVLAGDSDKQQDDFLAVLDVRPNSPRYGQVVATVPVGVQKKTMPHHTEHEMHQSGILFANEFNSGQTLIFCSAVSHRSMKDYKRRVSVRSYRSRHSLITTTGETYGT